MREVKRKSVIPVYGVAVVWLTYCLLFPLYKTGHFIGLVCSGVIAYFVFSAIFPGKTEYIELPQEPVKTGDDNIDSLILEGARAVSEMRSLRGAISSVSVQGKIDSIIYVTDKIFKNLIDDPGDYRIVRRFADYYLPATIKLLREYDRFTKSGVRGENITGTINRIDAVLDSILDSYNRLFDSLFENQAMDIETDIRVLQTLLKKEGFSEKDF